MDREIYSVVDICFLNLTLIFFLKTGAMVLDKRGQLFGLPIGGSEREFGQEYDLEHGFFVTNDIIFDDINS